MIKQGLFILIFIITIFQCKIEKKKMEIVVLDVNKNAIANCNIYFNLWKNASNSEESLSKLKTKMDENGRLFIDLNNVVHLDFVIETDGYIPYIKKGYYPKYRDILEILLNKNEGSFKANSSFSDNKNRLKVGIELNEMASKFEYSSIKDSIPNSNISVWIKSNDSKLNNLFICTNSSFGIIPIYGNEENSIMYMFNFAPKEGYLKEHLLDGTEKGYFIKSEVGFAKLILKDNIEVGTFPKNAGYVKYKYLYFDWIYNNSNDLSIKCLDIEKLLE